MCYLLVQTLFKIIIIFDSNMVQLILGDLLIQTSRRGKGSELREVNRHNNNNNNNNNYNNNNNVTDTYVKLLKIEVI